MGKYQYLDEISGLDQTGEFYRQPPKRYDNTSADHNFWSFGMAIQDVRCVGKQEAIVGVQSQIAI